MTSHQTTEFLRTAVEIADPETRLAASDAFARLFGGSQLIMFVRDPVVGQSLPAPGFPQTLHGKRFWKPLLDRAIASGSSEGDVPGEEGPTSARAVGSLDGTVAVLLGRTIDQSIDESRLEQLRMLLPFFGSYFRVEAVAQQAKVESTMARQAAAQFADLATKLDTARTDLQRALDVAEKATRTRDEFLAIVSHELRTPLTSIIGWVQLLRDERDWTAIEEGLVTVERNARLQSRLIEDILDFSRINSGKLRLDVAPTNLVDVVKAAIAVVYPAADAKGIEVRTTLDESAGFVSGDGDRLQQVVWNLLSNAVKFTPAGGHVHLTLARVDSHCELTVTDDGEGIAPEFLPLVFDRFSQADSSSRRVHAGLGLGMGIVRHLVELHGGSVRASSAGVGSGASFVVRLPLHTAQHRISDDFVRGYTRLSEVKSREQRRSELAGVSVLVVSADEDARLLLNAILTRSGAEVHDASDTAAAMEILSSNGISLLINDLDMDDEDAYFVIREIRDREPAMLEVPAIAVTSFNRSSDRTRAMDAGFQLHMGKPVDPAELVAAVRSLVTTESRKN